MTNMNNKKTFVKNKWLVAFLLILIIVIAGVYFFRDKIDNKSGWRIHENVKQGYTISLPKSWTREAVEGAAEVFWSPDKRAYVAVQFIADPRLMEEDGEEKMIGEIRESFRKDPDYKLSSFRSRFEKEMPEPATASGYLAQGYLNYQKERFVFQEYAVQIGDEEILAVIRGAMMEGAVKDHEETVEEIMGSFNPVAGRREAIALVKKQKEVKEYEGRLKKVGSKATFAVTDDGESWLVQVYEVVEQGEEAHTATFNWYRVNKETKKITKEFETNE